MRGFIVCLLFVFPLSGDAFCFLAEIRQFLLKENIKGAVVGVYKRGRIEKVAAFGHQTDGGALVDVNSRFPLASLSKIITAASIRRMVALGKLRLDERVAAILLDPSLENAKQSEITVRHLLQHTSGLATSGTGDPLFDAEGGVVGCNKVVDFLLQKIPVAPAGKSIEYSNVGYCLLGRVLEKISGESYEKAARDLLSSLRDLNDLTLGPSTQIEIEAWGYSQNSWKALGAAGGWFASATTIASFCATDAKEASIYSAPPVSFKEYYYGLGWRVWPQPRGYFLSHFGNLPGVFSLAVAFPDGSCAVGLFNGRPKNAEAAARFLIELFARKVDRNGGGFQFIPGSDQATFWQSVQ